MSTENVSWNLLLKRAFGVHISYRTTFTNNLYANNLSWRLSPAFELRLDLNGNLKTKNRNLNSYIDAMDLSEYIESIKMVQIIDNNVLKNIISVVKSSPTAKNNWKLYVDLKREFSFNVKPRMKKELEYSPLFLDVI